MQVAIPHDLGREEVRRRLKSRSHELAGAIPGGMAEVQTDWPNQDRMNMSIQAVGQALTAWIRARRRSASSPGASASSRCAG